MNLHYAPITDPRHNDGYTFEASSLTCPPEAQRKLGRLSAADLLMKELPPVRYVVPGYLAEGLTILAGRPKLGKSWLSLDLAIAVASGGLALGTVPADEGDVLYLALEDNERRPQKRLLQLLPPSGMPRRLFIETECPRLDHGGTEAIRDWVESAHSPRLVVVDVFNKIHPEARRNENPYEADYRALAPLKHLADEKGIAVLIVHHTRKMEAEDPFDTVSGTTGFTGAADTVLVLARSSQGTTPHGRGRDIEEIDIAVSFDRHSGRWSVLGAASEVRRTDERSAILEVLKEADEAMSPADIGVATGAKTANTKQLLFKMAKVGEVQKLKGRGRYVHPDRTDMFQEGRLDNLDNPVTDDEEADND